MRFRFMVVAVAVGLIAASCGDSGDTTTTTAEAPATTAAVATTSPPATEAATTSTAAPTTAPAEMTTVKAVILPFISFAPFYIGIEEGYFAEQGIEVELLNLVQAEQVMPALASGQADVSSGLVSAGIFNAISRGADIRMVADKGNIDPTACISYAAIGRKELIESGVLDTPAGLDELTINTIPTTWLEYYLSKLLAQGGLTLDDVTPAGILDTSATPGALSSGELDIAMNSEPWLAISAGAGHLPVLDSPQEILPNDTVAMMLYGPTLLGDNRDVGIRFMAAYLKGVAQYAEGKTARNLDIIEGFTQLDRQLLEGICWPSINPTGEVNTAGIADFQQFALDRGYIDEIVNTADYYDAGFVTEASALLDG